MRLCLVNINDALWCLELSIFQVTLVPGKVMRFWVLLHERLFENKTYAAK